MIVNKLNKEMKDSMHKRTRTGLLMLCYGLAILFCLTLTDQSNHGWAYYLSNNINTRRIISFIFTIVSVIGIAWTSVFIARELHGCFINTGNKKQVLFITICMLLIQLIPTVIWLCPNYFTIYHKLLWLLTVFLSPILISLICLPFLFIMVKNGNRSTVFNKIVFPLCVIGMACVFCCIYYLGIVRYWTTILILIASVVGCDIAAYFAGVLFGKHKMAPIISPKKSWEGAIIGSFVSAGIVILFIFLFTLIPNNQSTKGSMNVGYNFFGVQFESYFDGTSNNWVWWVVISDIAIVLTVCSICGDLLFSWFKRKNNIKDFGNSIPGHGGYLDRLDSFAVVVIVFTVVTFIISLITTIYHAVHHDLDIFRSFFPDWYH